jgi:glycosyltransferase involved in cell wall biosynthesis
MSQCRRWRIAVLNRHFGKRYGGAEHYSAAIVEQLAPLHDVHVFAQEIEHSFPNVSYHKVSKPFNRPRWINQLWFAMITWMLTRRGFDIVHSHENTWHGDVQTIHVRPFRAGLFYGKTGWRRSLVWLKLLTSPRLLTYWWLEWARMRPMPNRKIVATSEVVKQEILNTYPSVASILYAIPPGVKLPSITPNKQTLRHQLGLNSESKLALFIGNDYIKKGLPTLLRAMVNVENLHVAVVGDTRHKSICLQQAQSMGIEARVHFLGSLENVETAYASADLLVHPTTEDTYGMVVLEAMAYGLPVIVSGRKYCGITADLSNGREAMILDDPTDANQLGQLIHELISDIENERRLIIHGKQFAKERNWYIRMEKHHEIFNQIAMQAGIR